MTSIVIPAHNEASSIGANLDALLAGAVHGEFEIVVVANGCTDTTAAVARARGVAVIDLAEPGKAGALDAGDAATSSYPRVYLDADIMTDAHTLREVCSAFRPGSDSSGAVLAAAPGRHLVLTGRPWAVRSYYAIQSRLPAARNGLYGRGMIALSDAGRQRFGTFPRLIADDLYLDSLFSSDEKRILSSVSTTVETPMRTRDLVRRLARVRRGNALLRKAAAEGKVDVAIRQSDRTSWLRDVVLREPSLAVAAVVYVVITVAAAVRARSLSSDSWLRDDSSRESAGGRVA
ncbi:glycosyltransferase family 2 protein [Cellulomonas sp. ICMP 17802]|uniref:glycosyltransferase family 2 protein n=1 Tax=Cellulomonas sp. ICMP 17802 TaxID=3239199 RepID=UPI00351BDBF7